MVHVSCISGLALESTTYLLQCCTNFPLLVILCDIQSFFLFLEGCSNSNSIVEDITNLAPYVLVTGMLDNPEQAFLEVDRKIVMELQNFLDVPFSLMSAFFVFNIQ